MGVDMIKKLGGIGGGLGLSSAAVIWIYSTFYQKSDAEADFVQVRTEENRKDDKIYKELRDINRRLDSMFLNQPVHRRNLSNE